MAEPSYRICYLDIETAPSLGWVWQKYQTDVIAFEADWYILSCSILWNDEKKPQTYCLPDFPGYKKDPENDIHLIEKIREALDAADLVIAHNGDSFDLPKIRARMAFHHLAPPSPFKTYDTLRVARRLFAFTSNKLNDLGVYLQAGEKVPTGGFDLWLRTMRGDKEAWAKMRKYNGQDVILLRNVYNELKIWDPAHPNISLNKNEDLCCPVCGHSKYIERRGFLNLQSFRAQRFICNKKKGGCGKWSSGKRERIQVQLLKSA